MKDGGTVVFKRDLKYILLGCMIGLAWFLCVVFGGSDVLAGGTGLLLPILEGIVCTSLLMLAEADIREHEIPLLWTCIIAGMGVIRLATDYTQWYSYLIGAVVVSGVMLAVYFKSNGSMVGGGDIKLMAAVGLFLGWKLMAVATLATCIYALTVYPICKYATHTKPEIVFGPYVAAGVMTAMWWGAAIWQAL